MLGVSLRERPASVTALVALMGRAQPNVSRSLQLLAKHRLILLVRDGREVRPEPIAGAVRPCERLRRRGKTLMEVRDAMRAKGHMISHQLVRDIELRHAEGGR